MKNCRKYSWTVLLVKACMMSPTSDLTCRKPSWKLLRKYLMREFQPSIISPILVLFPVLAAETQASGDHTIHGILLTVIVFSSVNWKLTKCWACCLSPTSLVPNSSASSYLVKSVFRAPVPAYCLERVSALSAHTATRETTTSGCYHHLLLLLASVPLGNCFWTSEIFCSNVVFHLNTIIRGLLCNVLETDHLPFLKTVSNWHFSGIRAPCARTPSLWNQTQRDSTQILMFSLVEWQARTLLMSYRDPPQAQC